MGLNRGILIALGDRLLLLLLLLLLFVVVCWVEVEGDE